MSYQLKWSKIAIESLEKLPTEIAERILKKLDQATENPRHFIEGLQMNINKIKAGDYRILVDLLENEKVIAIRDLGHRKNIYKRYKTG